MIGWIFLIKEVSNLPKIEVYKLSKEEDRNNIVIGAQRTITGIDLRKQPDINLDIQSEIQFSMYDRMMRSNRGINRRI